MNKSEEQLVRKATVPRHTFSMSGDAAPQPTTFIDKAAVDNKVKLNLQLAQQRADDPGTNDRYRVELEQKSRAVFISSVVVGLICATAYKFVELRKL